MRGETKGLPRCRNWSRAVALLGFIGSVCLVARGRLKGSDDGERGDVPGWVMVTLMNALLVVALLALAGPALTNMFNDAINRVRG